MRLLWLADALRNAGCRVHEVPGWQGRGKDLTSVQGVVWHHTATGTNWTDERVDRLLVDGRADLPGPLAQLGLRRDGTFVVVASGKANHNGYGQWGNASIGMEAYNNGLGEPWPRVQLDAYDRGTAAILRALDLTPDRVKGHRETDSGRKIDPAGIDMDDARRRIRALLDAPSPAPEPKGWLMALTDKQQADLYDKVTEIHAELCTSRDEKSPDGETVLHRLVQIDQRTSDIASGKRPAKG